MIIMTLLRKIFTLIPPDLMVMPDNVTPRRGLLMPGLRG
jgi:hypothetical protein